MHDLIAGMTASGKTTLAKKLIIQYKAKGIKTAVLDPLQDPDFAADFQTDNNEEFLNVMYTSRKCALFVDESGAAIGRYGGSMQVLATQSRHFGHRAHFLTQRPSQLDKTIRDQCSRLFLFKVSKTDCKTLADEYDCEEILQVRDFRPGQCFMVSRFEKPIFLDIFNHKKQTLDKEESSVPNDG